MSPIMRHFKKVLSNPPNMTPDPTNSATPLTDAAIQLIDVAFVGGDGLSSSPEEWVSPEFCRSLEQRVAELDSRLSRANNAKVDALNAQTAAEAAYASQVKATEFQIELRKSAEAARISEQIALAAAQKRCELRDIKVRLCLPTPNDPFAFAECEIEDVGYADLILAVKCREVEQQLTDARRKLEAKDGVFLTKAQYDNILQAMRHDGQLVTVLRAEVEVLEVYRKRLEWLHTGGGPADYDSEGFEWGVFRVKYDANGKMVEGWQTFSDYSDLDAEMARQAALAPVQPGQAHCENCDWTFDCFTDRTKCRKPSFRMKEAT
jgi:hypothetical protein